LNIYAAQVLNAQKRDI